MIGRYVEPWGADSGDCELKFGGQVVGRLSRSPDDDTHSRLEKVQTWCYLEARGAGYLARLVSLMEVLLAL